MGCVWSFRRPNEKENRFIANKQLTTLNIDDQSVDRGSIRRSKRRLRVSSRRQSQIQGRDGKALDISNVDGWNIMEATSWLEYYDIPYTDLETLAEMKLLVKQKLSQMPKADSSKYTLISSSEDVLEEAKQNNSKLLDTSKVDQWDFMEMMSWFEDNEISCTDFETLEEMKLFVKLKTSQMSNASPSYHTVINTSEIKEVFEKANRMRADLERVFIDLRQLTTRLDQAIPHAKTGKLESYKRHIPRKMDDLKCKEYPLLVLGETSSGKSSFINLLVGVDLLPTALLAESSAICCLHNCSGAYFILEYTDCKKGTKRIDVENHEDMPKKLAESISRRDGILGLKKVDVYFPIPFLPYKTTIVDSPGVGENDVLTRQILQFMPETVACIYVVDSSNAGGVQPDKLCYLLEEQKRIQLEDECVPQDFAHTIVILNKWDIVEERKQEEEVFQQTKGQLTGLMMYLEEENIIKISIKRELRYRKLGLGTTGEFQQLLQSLSKVLPKTVTAKLERHFRWLEGFLSSIQEYLVCFKKSTSSSKHEMIIFKKDVQLKMETLHRMSVTIKAELDVISQKKMRNSCGGFTFIFNDS